MADPSAYHPPERQQLSITRIAPAPDILILVLAGEIDAVVRVQWLDALASAIDSPRLRLLICDCTDVGFVSIDGFLALIDIHCAARRRGVRIQLVNPPSTLVRLLTMISGITVTATKGTRSPCPPMTRSTR